MRDLGLSPASIKLIIDSPSSLSSPAKLGVSPSVANEILNQGYRKGFREVFILNACLTAVATIVSVVMIKDMNLTREDEEELKLQAGNSGGKSSPRFIEK
ncbi:hypothetical protein BYT27DRAFT_7254476 [Phlegmacium glaucopus]|nr:hypothetical protein BYT27DRAFT_7254476 [Phlegmacium glaucopus]